MGRKFVNPLVLPRLSLDFMHRMFTHYNRYTEEDHLEYEIPL